MGRLRRIPADRRAEVDIFRQFETAKKEIIASRVAQMEEDLAAGRDHIIGMAKEWAQTGKMVQTRWAADYDRTKPKT